MNEGVRDAPRGAAAVDAAGSLACRSRSQPQGTSVGAIRRVVGASAVMRRTGRCAEGSDTNRRGREAEGDQPAGRGPVRVGGWRRVTWCSTEVSSRKRLVVTMAGERAPAARPALTWFRFLASRRQNPNLLIHSGSGDAGDVDSRPLTCAVICCCLLLLASSPNGADLARTVQSPVIDRSGSGQCWFGSWWGVNARAANQ